MSDIQIAWSPQAGVGEWVLTSATASDGSDASDLATAVLISLFTDGEAGADDVIPDGTADPRGWWGDIDTDRPIGSKIWLLSRSKQTATVLALAKQYLADALRWLLDDGIAAAVDVTTEWTRPGMLGAQIVITRADGTNVALQFAWAWSEIA